MQGIYVTAATRATWGLGLGLCLWAMGVDVAVTLWLDANYHQGFNTAMRWLGEVGKGSFQATLCAFMACVLWGQGKASYKPWAWCIPVFAVAGVVGWVIKVAIGRPRPKEMLMNGANPMDAHPWVLDAGFWSFPSGHAVSTFAIATVLAAAYPVYRKFIWPIAGVLAVSRFLALTPHYMGDVIAGAAVGVAVAGVCVAYLNQRKLLT
ncbi:MAG: phosphatase PAP2 family protein [Alphaproteobacteria bacterium]